MYVFQGFHKNKNTKKPTPLGGDIWPVCRSLVGSVSWGHILSTLEFVTVCVSVCVFNLIWILVKLDPLWKCSKKQKALESWEGSSSFQTWPGFQASSLCKASKHVRPCNERWNRAEPRPRTFCSCSAGWTLCTLGKRRPLGPLAFVAPSHLICLFPWR